MIWFPQLASGSVAQYPVGSRRKWREIANDLESAERISLPDAAGGQVTWRLSYQDLSDAETANLNGLFTACQGRFGVFGFIDPLANLLGFSEDLARPDWQAGLLQTDGGVTDPLGTYRAWSVSNGTSGNQDLQQTLGIPGQYVACLSLWVRSTVAGTVTLRRDSLSVTVPVTSTWKRVSLHGEGTDGAGQTTFLLSLNPGQAVDVWGLQVETQANPSLYRQTGTALGIYEETYFDSDELVMTSVGPGRWACELTLRSRV